VRRFDGVDVRARFDRMPGWEACRSCSGGPTPGSSALMAWWLETYPGVGRSMGIYNCRNVAGSAARSVHSCGRASDHGVPVTAAGHAVGYDFLRRLGPNAVRLGVQLVIFNRTIWSATRIPQGERYNGVHPHYDHLHVELTGDASRRLTLATCRAVLGTKEDDVYVIRYGEGGPRGTERDRLRVARTQRVLQAAGHAAGLGELLPRFGQDGDYGDETAAAVDALAGRARLPRDGRVGVDVLVLDYARNWLPPDRP
jgi:hypothetical protein